MGNAEYMGEEREARAREREKRETRETRERERSLLLTWKL